ncbi:MAG: hypothetical protein LBT71_01935 [Azoarcus sp.]|jgi:hypothetical protein|nr:hypothetical protein [Azoarcus sp.]
MAIETQKYIAPRGRQRVWLAIGATEDPGSGQKNTRMNRVEISCEGEGGNRTGFAPRETFANKGFAPLMLSCNTNDFRKNRLVIM